MSRAFAVGWKPRDLARTEVDLERDILQYLELRRYWALQTHSGKRRPVKRGALDIVFGKGEVWGCIETKAEDGVLSDDQLKEMERVQRAGGKVIVALSLSDVIAALSK